MFRQVCFFAGKQCNYKNWVPSMLRYKFLLILMGIKQNKNKMKQKLRIIGSKKLSFSNPPILNLGTIFNILIMHSWK